MGESTTMSRASRACHIRGYGKQENPKSACNCERALERRGSEKLHADFFQECDQSRVHLFGFFLLRPMTALPN